MEAIGLLLITAIPVVTGASLSISEQKKRDAHKADAKRMLKFHIDVYCEATSSRLREIHEHRLVLKDGKVFLGPIEALNPCEQGYVAEAFYIEYPDTERVPVPLGLVSQVADNPPLLNWLYVDKDTMELRYGNKSTSIVHHVGPWNWTEDEEGITFDETEAFTAVETERGQWQLYVDMDDDGLSKYVPKGKRKFGISLERTLVPGGEK